MYKLVITESYYKRARKFFARHPDILKQYQKILQLLCLNPEHPSLRLHKLSGRLSGLCSVSVTISYRIILRFIIKKKQIVPVDIGSHDEVY